MSKTSEQNYEQLKQALDAILVEIRRDDIVIEEALQLHKEGKALIVKLQAYLKDIEKGLDLAEK